MVAVVQLVEHQVVILGVAGSIPVSHPNIIENTLRPTGRRVFSFSRPTTVTRRKTIGSGTRST